MKYKIQYLFSLLLLAISVNSVDISEDVLNAYKYGAEEFQFLAMGDTGTENEVKQIMSLSDFELLIHLGDYDYLKKPDLYFDEILSSKYKFMGVMGNHEGESEVGSSDTKRYLSNIKHAMVDSGAKCEFSNSYWTWSCVHKNMRVIGISAGISGAPDRSDQLEYLKDELEKATEDWKICAWHFYDKYYHTGKYPDDYEKNILSENGSGKESFYDVCRKHGALIFSAHDHVYARTKVLANFKDPEIDEYDSKTNSTIAQIRNGATLNILNGAGGYEIYEETGEGKRYKHWEKKYALGDNNENQKKYGGLYCKMNIGGNKNKAKCRFLRINTSKKEFDQFQIYKNEDPKSQTPEMIDELFKNEKIKAYKTANGIVDVVNGNGNGNGNENNGSEDVVNTNDANVSIDNPSNEEESKEGKSSKVIIIVSSSSALAFVAGVALFINRKKKKEKFLDSFAIYNDKNNLGNNAKTPYDDFKNKPNDIYLNLSIDLDSKHQDQANKNKHDNCLSPKKINNDYSDYQNTLKDNNNNSKKSFNTNNYQPFFSNFFDEIYNSNKMAYTSPKNESQENEYKNSKIKNNIHENIAMPITANAIYKEKTSDIIKDDTTSKYIGRKNSYGDEWERSNNNDSNSTLSPQYRSKSNNSRGYNDERGRRYINDNNEIRSRSNTRRGYNENRSRSRSKSTHTRNNSRNHLENEDGNNARTHYQNQDIYVPNYNYRSYRLNNDDEDSKANTTDYNDRTTSANRKRNNDTSKPHIYKTYCENTTYNDSQSYLEILEKSPVFSSSKFDQNNYENPNNNENKAKMYNEQMKNLNQYKSSDNEKKKYRENRNRSNSINKRPYRQRGGANQ